MEMASTIFDALPYLGVVAIWLAGIAFFIAGGNWGRLISYRLTATHLEIRYAGIRVSWIAFSDITDIDRVDLGHGFFRCLGLDFTSPVPWSIRPLDMEIWLSRFCGTMLVLQKRRGGRLAITPSDGDHFVAELWRGLGAR